MHYGKYYAQYVVNGDGTISAGIIAASPRAISSDVCGFGLWHARSSLAATNANIERPKQCIKDEEASIVLL